MNNTTKTILAEIVGVCSLATDVAFSQALTQLAGGHTVVIILAAMGVIGIVASKVLHIQDTNATQAQVDNVATVTNNIAAVTPAVTTVPPSGPAGGK